MSEENILPQEKFAGLSFIESFLGTLIAPSQTFKALAQDCKTETAHLPAALAIVVLVFAADALRLTPANGIGWAAVNIPTEVSGGILLWLLSASTVSLTALCFGIESSKARAAFVTLAWSLLPWIFMGPLSCFWKLLGPAHVLLMAIPLCWILLLQIIAIKESFQLKVWQTLVLVFIIPPMLSSFQLFQFLQALTATLGSLLS
ncbi:MAG: YIP1 family protein [Candidatus Obscuribacterales bacterium]|nr:YIP1 family protein [Candidatus Obscuribacterales bacterium]